MTTHEILVAARNLLEREGWHRSMIGVGHCAIQATYNAGGGNGLVSKPAEEALASLLPKDSQSGSCAGYRVIRWNDEPGRTKEEVLALFDRAIAATAPAPADPFTTDRFVAEVV